MAKKEVSKKKSSKKEEKEAKAAKLAAKKKAEEKVGKVKAKKKAKADKTKAKKLVKIKAKKVSGQKESTRESCQSQGQSKNKDLLKAKEEQCVDRAMRQANIWGGFTLMGTCGASILLNEKSKFYKTKFNTSAKVASVLMPTMFIYFVVMEKVMLSCTHEVVIV
eukprot:TRINITY_DN4380_c0_g1_i6.p3 TRINITY_DN4380_c0_g1~~TRINITY_DN4380_c0_g1_i6.p3  ORF type:complete len:164 (-),score=32.44 TRINITY_DN4380_c0_g1_i6:299-790(-)